VRRTWSRVHCNKRVSRAVKWAVGQNRASPARVCSAVLNLVSASTPAQRTQSEG
jgi:hypothetical protein